MKLKLVIGLGAALICGAALHAQEAAPLPGTQPLTMSGDLSAQMVAGIDRFLMRETQRAALTRSNFWRRDFSSPTAYADSVATNRSRLREIIGAVDARLPVSALALVGDTTQPSLVAENELLSIHAVRWPVFAGVHGEGLWLRPKREPVARIVAVPDADQTPEMLAGLAPGLPPERQFARRLAEQGCEVIVPVLINRDDTWSGNEKIKRFTNQPHREWIYRQSFEMGRTLIGYEVQKVLAAVDWFSSRGSRREEARTSTSESQSLLTSAATKIGVVGYAEGGLIAFYAAALDQRVDAALVSGYFDSRQRLWSEPIYRNLFGLLREFGDAEIATLIAPRALVVEYSAAPKVDGPPKPREGRAGAAPGRLVTPEFELVEAEFNRARALLTEGGSKGSENLTLISGTEGMVTGPGSDRALVAFLKALGANVEKLALPAAEPVDARVNFDPTRRQHQQLVELQDFTQKLFRESEPVRAEFFWKNLKPSSAEEWVKATASYKDKFWEENIGRLASESLPANPRSRKKFSREKWAGYEMVLDVHPDVFAWGYLLLPNDVKPGEQRPVVVCQHGLEGVPDDVVTDDSTSQGYRYYKSFAAKLAERGFVVFAPHNPYRGGDAFRVLQRKANPMKLSLFSFILAQHDRILEWLAAQPFVDKNRIGFYGLSYGGKTAMRVPALLDRYALSICSADFNEWVRKNISVDYPGSYMFVNEYEIFEWNLGHTFNYAEMAALIAPRPFMVERGHHDGVAPDEWVAHEFARVRRFYAKLGIADRTEIEFFNGPHTINGQGTYRFLHKHLNWPESK